MIPIPGNDPDVRGGPFPLERLRRIYFKIRGSEAPERSTRLQHTAPAIYHPETRGPLAGAPRGAGLLRPPYNCYWSWRKGKPRLRFFSMS
jgi:hypothetical protein